MTNRKVLLVEDEKPILTNLAKRIRGQGYEVLTAGNGAEALKIFHGTTILVVVTDMRMPGKGGLEVLREIKRHKPATRVIVMTGFGSEQAIPALNSQAFYYIEKGTSGANTKLLHAIEKAFAEAEVQIRVEREMLSFLTHSLFSAISGGPKTVERVLKYAQLALGSENRHQDVHKMITNIARLKAIFMSMAGMLSAYQTFVNEPEAFQKKWQDEQTGDVTLSQLVSLTVRQTLASLLFEESNIEQLNRLLASDGVHDLSTIRETFLADVFWSEDAAQDLNLVLAWLDSYLPIASVTIKEPAPRVSADGVRQSFLFAIFSEVIYNAFKYTDGSKPIKIAWTKRSGAYVFSCSNTFSSASTRRTGSQKGIAFIRKLTEMIDGVHVFTKTSRNSFDVEIQIRQNTLDGGGIK
jgi:CheY-like chemotaxis protein